MRSVTVFLVGLAAACSGDDGHTGEDVDCTKITGADVFVVGLAKDGNQGKYDFKMMSADPAPPARGDNTWIVELNDMNGAALDGATLTVTPFMPSHGHGTPITVQVMPAGTAGQYTLSPVNLWMPGVWETTVRATSGTTVDSAVFTFCIN